MLKFPLFLLVFATVVAGTAQAATLTCKADNAWRADASLIQHPADFYGLAEASEIRADPDAGTISSKGALMPGMVMTSKFDAGTGADLVFAAPDGSLLFRARNRDDAITFLLIDAYDIYVGKCVD